MTAYQMVHIIEGVVQRGTATVLRDLNRPLFGKTGTTSGPTNVWFIGGTPQIVAGVYMGFDQPRPMGGYAQGGTLAAPIFKQFAQAAFEGHADRAVPRARRASAWSAIDRRSGQKVFGAWPTDDPKSAVIWEAFKPESEPRRTIRRDEMADRAAARRAEAGPSHGRRPARQRFLAKSGRDLLGLRASAAVSRRKPGSQDPPRRRPEIPAFAGMTNWRIECAPKRKPMSTRSRSALALLRRFLDWDRALKRLDELNARGRGPDAVERSQGRAGGDARAPPARRGDRAPPARSSRSSPTRSS